MSTVSRIQYGGPDPFSVEFGREAWTLLYKDAQGSFIFTEEPDIAEFQAKGTTKRVFLSNNGLTGDYKIFEPRTDAERQRLALVRSRVVQYLSSCGYEVV